MRYKGRLVIDAASSLAFEVIGPSDAPPIVFLHGGGASGWMWQPVIAHLPDYLCYTPDLPEQGKSQHTAAFSMESAADAAAALIGSQIPAGKAHVVGLSEGAQVLVALLARHPQVVTSAFISSALLRPLPGMGWLTPKLLSFTYRTSVAPFRQWDAWIRLNMKYSAGIPDLYFPQFKREFQSMTESGFVHMMMANQRFRLPDHLAQAAVPSLIIAGQHEYAVMKQSARDLAAALPHARACLLDLGEGSSLAKEHNWALTAPDLFAAALRAWLEHQPLPQQLKFV